MTRDLKRFSRSEARYEFDERYERAREQDWQVVSMPGFEFAVKFSNASSTHVVTLAADAGEFEGGCTCRDFEYRQTVCKHIWAVLNAPHAAVLDVDAGLTPTVPDRDNGVQNQSRRPMTDGGVSATHPHSQTNGGAPTYGDDVEIAVAERFHLELIDAPFYDARATGDTPKLEAGTPIQIKGTQEKIRNGYDQHGNQQYTSGRLTFWREELLDLLADDGRYIVSVYQEDRDPAASNFLTHIRALTPEQVGEAAAGGWHAAHRPVKGERAKVTWTKLMGSDPDV